MCDKKIRLFVNAALFFLKLYSGGNTNEEKKYYLYSIKYGRWKTFRPIDESVITSLGLPESIY